MERSKCMNVPKIRFKEFKENWDNPIIDSIFELRNGYTPSKSIKEYWENGTIPWYRMEDIRAKGNILSEAFQYILISANNLDSRVINGYFIKISNLNVPYIT